MSGFAWLRARVACPALQLQALSRGQFRDKLVWRAPGGDRVVDIVASHGSRVAATFVAAQPAASTRAKASATALVLVHGSHGPLSLYRYLAERFAQRGIGTLLPDLPAFGRTPAPQPPYSAEPFTGVPAVKAAVEWLGAQSGIDRARIHVLGHSFGASVALAAARQHASLVRSVIALGPSRRVEERAIGVSAKEAAMWQARFALSRRLKGTPSPELMEAVSRATGLEYHMDYWKAEHPPALLVDCEMESEADRAFLKDLAGRMSPPISYRTLPAADHYLNSGSFGRWVVVDRRAVDAFVAWTMEWLALND